MSVASCFAYGVFAPPRSLQNRRNHHNPLKLLSQLFFRILGICNSLQTSRFPGFSEISTPHLDPEALVRGMASPVNWEKAKSVHCFNGTNCHYSLIFTTGGSEVSMEMRGFRQSCNAEAEVFVLEKNRRRRIRSRPIDKSMPSGKNYNEEC